MLDLNNYVCTSDADKASSYVARKVSFIKVYNYAYIYNIDLC